MKRRPAPQRRSKPSLRGRLRTYWILGVLLLAAASYAGWAFATLPAFKLSALRITGVSRVSKAEVAARAAIDPQTNIWLLNRSAIARRIEAIPYVEHAYIHRRPLGKVWIEVLERRPEGCVRDALGAAFTIDGASRVLELGCTLARLPAYRIRAELYVEPGTYLSDPELLVLRKDAHALGLAKDRYRAFSHDAFGDFEATLRDGIQVRFGDDGDLDRKERLVGPILAELGTRAAGVRAVDVRAPATPVVEYRTACTTCTCAKDGTCASK